MSTVEYNFNFDGLEQTPPAATPRVVRNGQILHRVGEVRQEQGLSVRSVARRLGISLQDVREQEQPESDLTLSQLREWQRVLDVPIADLLAEGSSQLSSPINQRAKMLRVMKTAKALAETCLDPGPARMTAMLVSQLVDLMPELAHVSAWHSVGQRRTQDEMGRIVERTIPDAFFGDGGE